MVPRVANDRTGFQSRYDGAIVITLKLQRFGASNKEKENRDAQSIAGARRKDKIRQGLWLKSELRVKSSKSKQRQNLMGVWL